MADDGQSDERCHVGHYVPGIRKNHWASLDEGPEAVRSQVPYGCIQLLTRGHKRMDVCQCKWL